MGTEEKCSEARSSFAQFCCVMSCDWFDWSMDRFLEPQVVSFYSKFSVEVHVVKPYVGDSFYVEGFFLWTHLWVWPTHFMTNYGL